MNDWEKIVLQLISLAISALAILAVVLWLMPAVGFESTLIIILCLIYFKMPSK